MAELGTDGIAILAEDAYYLVSAGAWTAYDADYLRKSAEDKAGEFGYIEIQDVTTQWGVFAIAGPKSRDVLSACARGDWSAEAFRWLSLREAFVGIAPVTVMNVSFSGELAYELNVPADYGRAAWEMLMAAGEEFEITPYGMEALGNMRIEKGHVAGPELDGRTTADDLGMGRMMSSKKDFIGAKLAQREDLVRADRKQVVGLVPVDGKTKLRQGAQLVEKDAPAEAGTLATGGKPIPMLWNHIDSFPIGKWTEVSEDERGLKLTGKFTMASTKAQEIHALAKDQVISGLSIGYKTKNAEVDESTGIRRLKELDLWEVSVVTFPMLDIAQIDTVKSDEGSIGLEEFLSMTDREQERVLTKRDARQLSRSAAISLMRDGIPALKAKRDAGEETAAHRMLDSILNDIRAFKGVQK